MICKLEGVAHTQFYICLMMSREEFCYQLIKGIWVPAANTFVVAEVRLLHFYLSVLVPCYVVDSYTSLQLS